MTERTLEQELGNSFSLYSQAQNEYIKAVTEYMDGKFGVDNHRAEIINITEPEILGKNETQRSAYLDKEQEQELAALLELEKKMKVKRSQLEIAKKRFDYWMKIADLRLAGLENE